MLKLSLITTVLDSHEPLRRQVLYLTSIMPPELELIIVDDGSDPPLQADVPEGFRGKVSLIATRDFRPWTDSKARNIGVAAATGDMLLFFDVDQFPSGYLLHEAMHFDGDRLDWHRYPAQLCEAGKVIPVNNAPEKPPQANSFAMRRALFTELGGYDERYCGEYGFNDIDLMQRFNALCAKGQARPTVTANSPGYYWAGETPQFHSLERVVSERNAQMMGEGC